MEPTWDGVVIDIDPVAVTIELDSAFVVMDVARVLLPDVQIGDLVTVTPNSVVRKDLGRWTQTELDEIQARARERAAALQELAD